MNKITAGVLGASGYAGRELCDLIARHPAMALGFAAANSRAGEAIRVAGRDITLLGPDDVRLDQADVIFSALPHGASIRWVEAARAAGARVVDLSADLRPGNGAPTEGPLAAAPYGQKEGRRSRHPLTIVSSLSSWARSSEYTCCQIHHHPEQRMSGTHSRLALIALKSRRIIGTLFR